MSYYNWEKIAESKSDSELKKIYVDKSIEPGEKVKAVIAELKKRKLISDDETSLLEGKSKYDRVVDLKDIQTTRPNKKRAGIAQNFIWAVLIFEIISIYSLYLQYNLLNSFQNGEYISEQMANSNDLREQIIALIITALNIASGVTFILWFRRAYFNLHNRFSHCEYRDGWAVGFWFVPIMSLFRPYQIMKELWVKTNKILKERSAGHFTFIKTSILGFWWALWIIHSYIGNYVMRANFKTETVEDLIESTVGDIVMSIFLIPLALITIKVIKTYSNNEELLYKEEQGRVVLSSVITADRV